MHHLASLHGVPAIVVAALLIVIVSMALTVR